MNNPEKKSSKILFINIALLLIVILIILITASQYISREKTIYYWDYANYENRTKTILDYPQGSVKEFFFAVPKETWLSTGEDYSNIPSIPLLPVMLTFGDSRTVFILGMALLYMLPYAFVVGALAVKLIPAKSFAVFWSAVVLILLTPLTWAPTLRGYPDTGSAFLIALAILIYFQDLRLNNWWQPLLIGFCVGLSILFRRHFAYDGIAFFAALCLRTLISFIQNSHKSLNEAFYNLIKEGLRIGLAVIFMVITLILIGWPFVDRAIHTNFKQLYSAWELPVADVIWYYVTSFGWIAWILAFIGYVSGIYFRVLVRPYAIFIFLFGTTSMLLWFFYLKIVGIHYTLHITTVVLLGFFSLIWTMWERFKGPTKIFALSAIGIYLIYNAIVGLANVDILNNTPLQPTRIAHNLIPEIKGTKLSELFSANYPPLHRRDYGEIIRLVSYLRSIAAPDDPIYVASVTELFSKFHLENAEKKLYNSDLRLNVLDVPNTTSRDYYPLERLLISNYMVLGIPASGGIKVVNVIAEAFTKRWEISKDFVLLPKQFYLYNGHSLTQKVVIYKRINETSLKTALDTLNKMQDYIGVRPGGQLSWLNLNNRTGIYVKRNKDSTYDIEINSLKREQNPTLTFVYIDGLKNQAFISGKFYPESGDCNDISLSVSAIDSDGNVKSRTQTLQLIDVGPKFMPSLKTINSHYLLFDINVGDKKSRSANNCSLSIRNITVSSNQFSY